MRNLAFKSLAFSIIATTFVACETNDEPVKEVIPVKNGAYILNYGKGNNKASLSYYDFDQKKVSNDVFALQNNDDELGDGANHMCIYGSKMYITLPGSSKIEILDLTGKRIRKIELKDEAQLPTSPRYIVSHGSHVYFTSYGGNVQRIDTLTLDLDKNKIQVGDFPEALTVSDNKLFVNNSKYTDKNVNDKGNTVSVIDLNNFTKIRDIEVIVNPYNQAITGKDGYVYIVSAGDWNEIKATVQRIDPKTYEVKELGLGSVIANHNDLLYVYYSVWGGESWLKTYDCTKGAYSENEFVASSTFSYINAMNVNPQNGDVYISDSPSGMRGNVFIFDTQGTKKEQFEVGYSPAGAYFTPNNKK